MAAELHTEDNKVQGCVSQASCLLADIDHKMVSLQCSNGQQICLTATAVQVWVHPHVDAGKIFWEADSDSALTKVGCIALENQNATT